MGITISQPAGGGECHDSPLAIAAVAEITQFTLVKLQALQAIWCSGSREEGNLASREADLSSALLRGSLDVKLQAALQFASDADKSLEFERGLSPEGLNFALTTLTSVAGFFGDPLVTAADVRRVVDDVCGTEGCCSSEELVKSLEGHSFVQQYVYSNIH
ncbi:hypothetical protein F442_07545 [Phytophthora nicotianae P10297]|uniref:Uncharacterized protein n=1 Tax=Phytophthora nicotianae P10297 TaxID=1317064 RepID=W2ZIY0_PHYNI|nr:hypothetical protein F442_07545 [Phytophthora nicotianae P10297]